MLRRIKSAGRKEKTLVIPDLSELIREGIRILFLHFQHLVTCSEKNFRWQGSAGYLDFQIKILILDGFHFIIEDIECKWRLGLVECTAVQQARIAITKNIGSGKED